LPPENNPANFNLKINPMGKSNSIYSRKHFLELTK
jgi:hypothetical protein